MKALLLGNEIQIDHRSYKVGNSWFKPEDQRVYQARNGKLLQWVKHRLSQHSAPVLIDIGAHTGLFTLLAVHMPELMVYAFEPAFADVLAANVAMNNLEGQVRVYNVALSNIPGVGKIHVPDSTIGSHATMSDEVPDVFAQHGEYHDEQVVVDTLDEYVDLLSIKPTVLKIDTEGMERMVVEGAENTIRQYKPDILVECIAEHTQRFGYGPYQTTRLLHSWGYTCKVKGNDAACIHGGVKSEIWAL